MATGDGDEACEMLASGLRDSIVRRYAKGPQGLSYLRAGTSCQRVMMLLFTHFQRRIAQRWPHLQVTHVYLHGNHGVAVLSFGKMLARQIPVVREPSSWKIGAVLDEKLR